MKWSFLKECWNVQGSMQILFNFYDVKTLLQVKYIHSEPSRFQHFIIRLNDKVIGLAGNIEWHAVETGSDMYGVVLANFYNFSCQSSNVSLDTGFYITLYYGLPQIGAISRTTESGWESCITTIISGNIPIANKIER